MESAAFSFKRYKFVKSSFDLSNVGVKTALEMNINPSGRFSEKKKEFLLQFDFSAHDEKKRKVVSITCVAEFSFLNVKSFSDIPEYFYANSIAIVFPYVRAFISTLTLQANVAPLVLPTMNLSSLKEQLLQNTVVDNE